MSIPTRKEYLANERRRYAAKCQEWAQAPLADRREARANYAEMLANPALLTERIGWIFEGNYGEIEMILAKEIINNKKCNRAARLSVMIAGLECFCPDREAQGVYKALDQAQRGAVDAALAALLSAHDNNTEEE